MMKKYEVIYNTYKESILSGILKYGDRVDSIRECVKKMNVSKTTVELAYNKLVLDGFISSKEKVGYVVSMNPERDWFIWDIDLETIYKGCIEW